MHIGAQGRYELQRYTFTPLKKACDAQKENFYPAIYEAKTYKLMMKP